MKTKVVVLLSGALIALLLLSRYFALSRAGMPLGWMLYLGLPITAAGGSSRSCEADGVIPARSGGW